MHTPDGTVPSCYLTINRIRILENSNLPRVLRWRARLYGTRMSSSSKHVLGDRFTRAIRLTLKETNPSDYMEGFYLSCCDVR